MEIRAGNGFDVHKFAKDRELFLGGIKIPYERGLAGHSDADVLIHPVGTYERIHGSPGQLYSLHDEIDGQEIRPEEVVG